MKKYGQAREQITNALRLDRRDANIRGFTSYEIARVVGYSPQHVNRILAQMWHEGVVAFRPKDKKHALMSPRLWSFAGIILSTGVGGWYVSETRTKQLEMSL